MPVIVAMSDGSNSPHRCKAHITQLYSPGVATHLYLSIIWFLQASPQTQGYSRD